MSEGLITRIGKWIDHRWAAKITEVQLQEQESKCSERHLGALAVIAEVKDYAIAEDLPIGKALADTIKQLSFACEEIKKLQDQQPDVDPTKELADLKTRMERVEVQTGMYRKVDPTKSPVVKSAFTM